MHMASGDGFLNHEDPKERLTDRHHLPIEVGAPDNELPGVVPLGVVLGRTNDLVVALTEGQVFSTGVRLSLVARMRSAESGFRFFDEVHDHSHGGADWPQLLLGVEYADGRAAMHLPGRRRNARERAAAGDPAPLLTGEGGAGHGRSADMSFWLMPVPVGNFTVVCAWPNRGIAETRTVIEGAALAAAASRVQVLWPRTPLDESTQSAPLPAPDLPEGWFRNVVASE
jgi:hypothetical protein